jgi:hypothetical protein
VAERGVYVYGVAAAVAADDLPRGAGALGGRRPLKLVGEGSLVALTSEVEVSWLQEQLGAAEEGDLAALEPLVRAHETVLGRALDADALVPFRFGTIFSDEAEVRAFVAERERQLEETLDRLTGAREWGVKALLEPETAEALATASDPQLAELAARSASGSGSAFFARKRLEVEQAERLRQVAAELAEECHARLAVCAREAALNAPQPPHLSGYEVPMILNGAYLVEREQEGDFRARLEQLREEYDDRGLTLELTGPWPAYNFVGATPAVVG